MTSEASLFTKEIIIELLKIPYIKLPLLKKIKHNLMITEDDSIKLSLLLTNPWNFLNQNYQLLTLNQVENIINHYDLDCEEWKTAAPVAFAFDYLEIFIYICAF